MRTGNREQQILYSLFSFVNANLPQEAGDIVPGVSNTPLGAGVFGGSNVISTQLTFKPTNSIDVGLNYAHSYHEINILGTGLVRDDIGALAGVELALLLVLLCCLTLKVTAEMKLQL